MEPSEKCTGQILSLLVFTQHTLGFFLPCKRQFCLVNCDHCPLSLNHVKLSGFLFQKANYTC